MNSNSFLNEAIRFVNQTEPKAQWQLENNYAVLFLEEKSKSICFIGNTQLSKLNEMSYHYFITEFQWNNNQDASKSRLCSLMGVTKRIHARECKIVRIDRKTARDFVDCNHTMGYANSYYNFGLFKKDVLVAVACFSKGRRMNRLPEGQKSFELIRFCNLNYHTVVGGLSKLIHYFETTYTPGDIMTYIDKSWGEPNSYYALGFTLDKITADATTTVMQENTAQITYTNKGNYKLIKYRD